MARNSSFAPINGAQILGVGYNHGSHGEVSAPGHGNWKLRTYHSSDDEAATMPQQWLATAQRTLNSWRTSLPFSLSTEQSTSILPLYYCGIHILALDFTQPPVTLNQGHRAPLPVAHIPAWICSSPYFHSRDFMESPPVDLHPKCIQRDKASTKFTPVSTSQLALIRRCHHGTASLWIACIKKDPLFKA